MVSEKKYIGEIRKKEICQAAIKCFVEKGFHNTTMEDVIGKTNLSKGGVYYYYKSTKEMIFDIFMEGNNYRIDLIKDYIRKNNLSVGDLANEEITAELMVEKILTDNPLMKVYAQFLIEINYDKELYETYQKIVLGTKESLTKLLPYFGNNKKNLDKAFEFITNIINTFIMGVNILDARENFEENKIILKEMIKSGLTCYKE
ncbi:TetR/AcrR family transcriptional regulator [Gemella cuniculi]|uniref:TetR/AcrR family transcriptional regulator n=1 Tax=Gemella cuniculi TaxID=150240 RepID=UPI00040C7CA1|nr:TetR/AcrR family transcriptional regulator [Gemella cuniculi]